MRVLAMILAVAFLTAGCSTKFEPDHDAITDPDATDVAVDEEIEIPEGCGNGEVEEGEECEGDATEECWTECGLEGHHDCNPLNCHWEPCTAPENCRNGCDDDGDGWEDCSDLDDCADHPDCEGCEDDEYEENDGPDVATAWDPSIDYNLHSCPGDDDYFTGVLTLGDEIVINAMFEHGEGNIDMDLTGPSGGTLDYSATITNDELIDFTATENGRYHLRVFLAGDTGAVTGNPYGLTFDITGATCEDDMFEDNDSLMDEHIITRGSHTGLMLCPADDDYYAASYSGASVYSIQVEFDHDEGDIDLYILDSSGGVLAESTSETDNETLTWSFSPGEVGHIRVTLAHDDGVVPGNAYDLNL